MEENSKDYKQEIVATRKGCLGSSDGKLLSQIVLLGSVPKSAYKRMAVVKGLIEQEEIPVTPAIQAGNDLEMLVFEHLKATDPRYESNPLWVSQKYSKPNVKLISHPDLVLKDDARKTLYVYEVKTTKYDFEATRHTYKAQLYIHNILAKEMALRLGKGWNAKVYLVHYSTNGLDLTNGIEFDTSRLTIKETRFSSAYFDVDKAMSIANDFLETFNEYYDGDEVDANLLPATVKTQFDDVVMMLSEIKEREKKVNEFKELLYRFMKEKDIKSIKNEVFSIIRVDDTESKSFDSKRYVDDLLKKYPRKARKIIAQYTKTIKRNGYAQIKVKK